MPYKNDGYEEEHESIRGTWWTRILWVIIMGAFMAVCIGAGLLARYT